MVAAQETDEAVLSTISAEQFRKMQGLPVKPLSGNSGELPKPKAKGQKRRVPGQMSKLEQEYERHLEAEKQAGRVLWFAYEAMKFKLADKTYYTGDFVVLVAGHFIEVHEVKGHWRMFQNDGGRIKIKCAAERFWWITFKAVMQRKKKDGGGWKVEEF